MTEVVSQPAACAVNGQEPERVAVPRTEAETAELLSEASSSGMAVIPVGGGTMLSVGNPPTRYDLAVSTRALTGIVEYNPADLTVVVRAGTTLAGLDRELTAHGQFLPLDAPYPSRATVGGALASNCSGPWRTAYGSARDMVIGMRMALPTGQVARSGGRVVKNVAGYDLAKLFIGSFGTLGIIVEAAFKTFPRPQVVRTLAVPVESTDDAHRLGARLRSLGPGLLALAEVSRTIGRSLGLHGISVLVSVGDTARATADLVDAVREITGAAEAPVLPDDEAAQLLACLRDFPGSATVKISTRPSDTGSALALFGDADWVAYPAVGLSYLRLSGMKAAEVTTLRAVLREGGGRAVLLHAPVDLMHEAGVWGSAGPELALMQRVKDVFDPNGTMSPGRFLV